MLWLLLWLKFSDDDEDDDDDDDEDDEEDDEADVLFAFEFTTDDVPFDVAAVKTESIFLLEKFGKIVETIVKIAKTRVKEVKAWEKKPAYNCLVKAHVNWTSSIVVAAGFVVLWSLMKPEDRYRPICLSAEFRAFVSFVHGLAHHLAMQTVTIAYKIHSLSPPRAAFDAVFDSQHSS